GEEVPPPRQATAEDVTSGEPRPVPSAEKDRSETAGTITRSPAPRQAAPVPLAELVSDFEDDRRTLRARRVRERPLLGHGRRRTSTLTIVAALTAGVLLVAGIVATVLIFRRGGEIPESEWKEFTAPDGSFSVQMPGTPVPLKQEMNGLTFQKYILVHGKERAE